MRRKPPPEREEVGGGTGSVGVTEVVGLTRRRVS